jgi:cell division protein FtsI (penicillin-binding protein 3)
MTDAPQFRAGKSVRLEGVAKQALEIGRNRLILAGCLLSLGFAAIAGRVVGQEVMKPSTSQAMRQLMRLVVVDGTGRNADAKGYLVGGKTGTAEKVGGGRGYARKSLISSFVAAFPVNDPKYVILVMVDEPKGQKFSHGYATGGWVAAPAVKRIVERAAPLLGVAPVDTDSPEIRRDLLVDLPDAGGKRLASF